MCATEGPKPEACTGATGQRWRSNLCVHKGCRGTFFVAEYKVFFLVEVSSKITSYQQMKWPLIFMLPIITCGDFLNPKLEQSVKIWCNFKFNMRNLKLETFPARFAEVPEQFRHFLGSPPSPWPLASSPLAQQAYVGTLRSSTTCFREVSIGFPAVSGDILIFCFSSCFCFQSPDFSGYVFLSQLPAQRKV